MDNLEKYCLVKGKSGRIWLYSLDAENLERSIHVSAKELTGYGNHLLYSPPAEAVGTIYLKGLKRSNAEALFEDTGVDLRPPTSDFQPPTSNLRPPTSTKDE